MRKHEIEQLIRSLGIGATYRGYHYLVYGVSLCMDNEDYLLSVGKLLYTRIAEAYSTTGSSVERDIRTVIRICWERGNRPLLQEIAMYPLHARPTAGEFFDILSNYLNNQLRTEACL